MIKTPLSTVIGGAFWTPGAAIIGSYSKTPNPNPTPTLNLTQLIETLFANNEQGFAYDPNDLTTLYQDAAGTVPVNGVGQAVGLMLDKSKQLQRGVNLTEDFDFRTWVVVGGAIADKTSFTVAMYGGVTSNIGMVIGKMYKIDIEYSTTRPNSAVYLLNGVDDGAPTLQSTNSGKISCYCLASNGSLCIQSASSTVTVTNFGVQEVLGNHAYQRQSAMRPLLVVNPQRLDYDTVDDKLTTNLPTELTGCTVIRSVTNVGTQILTGQTIPTIYNNNIDNCGLIVINRALTASETSQITKLFNKAAGV